MLCAQESPSKLPNQKDLCPLGVGLCPEATGRRRTVPPPLQITASAYLNHPGCGVSV